MGLILCYECGKKISDKSILCSNCGIPLTQNNSIIIIGDPIRIGKIEVAQHDFPIKMEWSDAISECRNLGSQWRLPTKEELNKIYLNKTNIVGLKDYWYWSATEVDEDEAFDQNFTTASNGSQSMSVKDCKFYVRAVRSLSNV